MSEKVDLGAAVTVTTIAITVIVGLNWLFSMWYSTHSQHWDFGIMCLMSVVNILTQAFLNSRK